MKHGYINHLFLVCALAFISFSCLKENAQVDDTTCNEGSFRATVEGSENAKAVLKNDGVVVWWEPNDEIQVFCGNQKGVFSSNATAASATTTFVGETHFSSEEGTPFLAVYPNSEDVTYDGSEAVVTIPHEQIAEAGTFDRRAFVMMAESNNRILNFKNLCGGIKISVSQNGIYKIVLRGSNRDVLAGTVKARFSEGIPVVTEVLDGQSTIELRRENDAAFEKGKWYFVSCVPAKLLGGLTVELFQKNNDYTFAGTYTKTASDLTIQRSVWCRINKVDDSVSYSIAPHEENLLYTTSDGELASLTSTGEKRVAKHYEDSKIGYNVIVFNTLDNNAIDDLFTNYSNNRNRITSIVLPSFLSVIRSGCFENFINLVSVTLPDSITAIGERAFRNCTKLTSITIPNSITSLGTWAFQDCSNLTHVTISGNGPCGPIGNIQKSDLPDYVTNLSFSEGITSITDGLFENWAKLKSVTIPANITSIGASAFNGCSGLTKVNISSLGAWCKIAFGNGTANPLYYAHTLYLNDTKITKLVIPDSVSAISPYAFYGCSGLTSVTFPDSVTSIGPSAFSNCTGLTSITLSNSLSSIGQYAFSKCTGITGALIIPNSVTSIGASAFYDCSKLTSVTIPNSVSSIGDGAFGRCSKLTRVDISSLDAWCKISFGDGTANPFSYAHSLYLNDTKITDLVIPDSVSAISPYAFGLNTDITGVTIPNSVTSIGEYAFSNCTGLTSITLSNSLSSIGGSAFKDCTRLTRVNISSLDAWCKISFGNTTANPLYYAHSLYINDTKITNLVIPDSVSSISPYAFGLNTDITSVTFPDSVTSIGQSAFYNCTGITGRLTIPNSVTSIGPSAFSNCTGLTSITFSNSLSSIGGRAFYGCTGLASVTIPSSVTAIGESAFYGCTGLASVTIPSSVTAISESAFYGCTGLTSITIPNSVTSIGQSAFYGCTGLTDIVVLPTTPPSGGRGMFNNNADSRMIYVPFNSVGDYQTAEYWKDYSSSITYIQ